MSMYTELLRAAVGPRRSTMSQRPNDRDGVPDRWRHQLGRDESADTSGDAVPEVLAREVAYDVALLELAADVGIATDVERFTQPPQERARLECALREIGVSLPRTDAADPTPPSSRG